MAAMLASIILDEAIEEISGTEMRGLPLFKMPADIACSKDKPAHSLLLVGEQVHGPL